MSFSFDKAAVIGVGLIGGSLALELRGLGLVKKFSGSGRTRKNLETALARGIIDQIAESPRSAAADADLILLCIPVRAIPGVVREIAPYLKQGAIVTDVGSTKLTLIRELEPLIPQGVHFVPGHPIAGSERTGADAAKEDLFKNRLTVLTPTPATDRGALEKIKRMWEAVGARVEIMEPALHDRVLGLVSHLPHMVAYSLVETVMRGDEQSPMLRFGAGGFHDFTRIAGSSPEMWRDICLENKEAILEALDQFQSVMSELRTMVDKADSESMYKLFLRSREAKERLKRPE